jgi:hypothetical protein
MRCLKVCVLKWVRCRASTVLHIITTSIRLIRRSRYVHTCMLLERLVASDHFLGVVLFRVCLSFSQDNLIPPPFLDPMYIFSISHSSSRLLSVLEFPVKPPKVCTIHHSPYGSPSSIPYLPSADPVKLPEPNHSRNCHVSFYFNSLER